MVISAPADPAAREWHTYDDTLVEMRKDARWSDALHKWETRVVMFDDAECERRATAGFLTPADRSI